jgi:large subunit ribosomal protein L21e
MAQRVGGNRRKTRHIFQNTVRTKGKLSIRRYLQDLQVGDKVLFMAQPAVQSGMYFKRYHGNTGTVSGKQGSCYMVEIENQGQMKQILVHPAHLVLQK